MDKSKIGYWIFTALLFVAIGGSGTMNLIGPDEIVANFTNLGYPLYVMSVIGFFKLAGALTIVAPGLPRLKEWAHAGILVAMVGATWSHIANGDPAAKAIPPLVILAISLASWALRPANRKLAGPLL